MGLGLISCGRQTAKVIPPDGQARQLHLPLSIEDLLRQYPHHYVRQVKGSILSTDAELKGGNTYLLLPLPRLFPDATLHPCSCRAARRPSSRISPQGFCGACDRMASTSHSCRSTRRGRLWEPSLDIIAENAMLLHSTSEQPILKKPDHKIAHRSYTRKQNSWDVPTAISLSAVAPCSFIF